MNRREAYEYLKDYLDSAFHYSNGYETYCYLRDCADTLAPNTPYPETGLVPCDFCNGSGEQKPLFHENNYKPHTCMESYIMVSNSTDGKRFLIEVDLWDGANTYAAFEINYCPMCGRKLEVDDD